MPSTIFVKPGPHAVVLMPERQMAQMPEAGALVPLDGYWHARLRDGDVIETPSPTEKAPVASASGKSAKS